MIGYGYGYGFGVQVGSLLNQLPIIPDGTPTSAYDITDAGFKVVSSVDTKISTAVTLEIGTATGNYNLPPVTAAESPLSVSGNVNFTLTGLTPFTDYYYRVKAVNAAGTAYSQEFVQRTIFNATLTATGTGAGVSTLRLGVSENQTLTITSGNARFYTDAAGTTGESTTWAITAGELRTIYLKAPSGNSVINFPAPDKVITWGDSANEGWISLFNAPFITIFVTKLALAQIRIIGMSTITGLLPSTLNYLRLIGANINLTYSTALPSGLKYLVLEGDNIKFTYSGSLPDGVNLVSLLSSQMDWTGLDVGNGNLTTLSLRNYRITKMSSPDMVTLLGQLTSRTGSLPNTITINDYADYTSPPQSVTDAVAALKAAKPNITTVNLGA